MGARPWMVAAALALAVAPAGAGKGRDPKPTRVDIKPFKDRLIVLRDGAGGTYVVLDPLRNEFRVWYGTGKRLYEQVKGGRSANGPSWLLSLWTPTLEAMRTGAIQKKQDGTYFKSCAGNDDAVLSEITGEQASALLDKTPLMTASLIRRPHLLARDDRGVYYYVDKLADHMGGKGFRVFVGKKGSMKQLTLTDLASDTGGEVFSTRRGELRLDATSDPGMIRNAVWIRGERRTELRSLDVYANSSIIFGDLGVYTTPGTICDRV